jgi:hypothetical protein
MYGLSRKNNSLIISEKLDENAMQTLLDLFIAERFPEQCDEWRASKTNISDFHSWERNERQRVIFEELASREHEIRRALCDAVVGDVVGLFPCVLFLSDPT